MTPCSVAQRYPITWLFLSGHIGNVPADARDEAGCTALIVAAINGHLAIVKQQLQHGANLGAKCNSGKTALVYAEERRHAQLADVRSSTFP